jgi:hypothetical protein
MQWQRAGLPELSDAHREHAIFDVEIVYIKGDRLADTHTGNGQQTDQCPIGRLSV